MRAVERAVYRRDGGTACLRCKYVEVAALELAAQHPCPICARTCLVCEQAAGESHVFSCMEMGLQPLAPFLAEKEGELHRVVKYGDLKNGAPCPVCSAPGTKAAGECNTITCACHTHFCFICGVGFGLALRDPNGAVQEGNLTSFQHYMPKEAGGGGDRPHGVLAATGGAGEARLGDECGRARHHCARA